jgi:hypothetical protein
MGTSAQGILFWDGVGKDERDRLMQDPLLQRSKQSTAPTLSTALRNDIPTIDISIPVGCR